MLSFVVSGPYIHVLMADVEGVKGRSLIEVGDEAEEILFISRRKNCVLGYGRSCVKERSSDVNTLLKKSARKKMNKHVSGSGLLCYVWCECIMFNFCQSSSKAKTFCCVQGLARLTPYLKLTFVPNQNLKCCISIWQTIFRCESSLRKKSVIFQSV